MERFLATAQEGTGVEQKERESGEDRLPGDEAKSWRELHREIIHLACGQLELSALGTFEGCIEHLSYPGQRVRNMEYLSSHSSSTRG